MDFWRNVGEYLSGQEGWIPGRDTAGKVKTTLSGGDADWLPTVSVQGGDRNPVGPTIAGVGAQGSSYNLSVPTDTGSNNNNNNTQVLGTGTGAPGGGAALPALNQAAINNTQIALDQLPALLQAALAAEQTRYGNTTRGFDTKQQQQQGQYDTSTTTNQQNYDANYMDSIRAGIKGMGNLFNLLRGTGAAGGTAQDQVRDVVGGVTAQDIRTGADTQKANQTSLDSALSNFLTELKGKRDLASDTFENNQRAIQRYNQTQLQDLYGKMAGYYSDAGRTADATNWMNKAGALTPNIAANSQSKQSAYDSTPIAVQAPQLSAFEAPSQPQVATSPQNGQVGSGIFTMERKKERDASLMPVGV